MWVTPLDCYVSLKRKTNMSDSGEYSKKVTTLLVSLYAIFFVLIVCVSIARKIILRNRSIQDFKKPNREHIYKIFIPGSVWLSLRSTSEVWLSVQGVRGTSDFFILPSKHYVSTAVTDECFLCFTVSTKECLDKLTCMTLLVREKGYCAWQVDTISVEDVQHETTYNFDFLCTLEITYKPRMYIASLHTSLLRTFVLKCVSALPMYHNWISALVQFKPTLRLSNATRLILIFVLFLHSLFIAMLREIKLSKPKDEHVWLLRLDTAVFLYLLPATLFLDVILYASKIRSKSSKNVWNYEVPDRIKVSTLFSEYTSIDDWLETEYWVDTDIDDQSPIKNEDDKTSIEIDLEEGDLISVDSFELESLTQQRFSGISSHFTLTPYDLAESTADDGEFSDTQSWMSFYDQESPFFIVSPLDKYTQFTTIYYPFSRPRQLVRNRIALWINFLQKWHKVQLRAIRTYRLLYAFWNRWQALDIDMGLLQREMNKMQDLVLQFQQTGQKIRDRSVWLEPHPLWRVRIELPQDEELILPYESLMELLEEVVVHVMSNFLDHYNVIQKQRKLSRDIEWYIEDWFRELLDAFLANGYLNKNDVEDNDNISNYWLPLFKKERDSGAGDQNLIHVVPVRRNSQRKKSSVDIKIVKIWYAWLPTLIQDIGEDIIQEIQKRTMGLNLVDSITYVQIQKEGCLWEEACVKIMGIMADVILRDIIKDMCVFLPEVTKRVILQRTRTMLADCLKEAATPWSTALGDPSYDVLERQQHYTLVSILRGCVSRCKAAPLSGQDVSVDDPVLQNSKVQMMFLLADMLQVEDLHTESLMPRLNSIAVIINDRIIKLKSCVGLIRDQFDSNLSEHAAAKDRIKQIQFAGVVNTLLTLCRLEMTISHVELCRDALALDIPAITMTGNYNRINFRQVFRLLATQYGQTRLGKRSLRRSTVRGGNTRVRHPGTVKLERRSKDVDADVAQLLLQPWIPPLHYVWGLAVKLILLVEIIGLTLGILEFSRELQDSRFPVICIIMAIGVLMDLIFIQPLKCFIFVLLHWFWHEKGIHHVYQKNPYTC